MGGRFDLSRISLDVVVPTLGAGQGHVADAALAAGAVGVHKAVPGPDHGQGPAARTVLAQGLAASPVLGLGESLTPSPRERPAPESPSHAVVLLATSLVRALMLVSLAPRAALKQSLRGIPEAVPRRSLSVKSPEAALFLQGRMEMGSEPSLLPVRHLLKKIVISQIHPASILHLVLLHDQSHVPGLLRKIRVFPVRLQKIISYVQLSVKLVIHSLRTFSKYL